MQHRGRVRVHRRGLLCPTYPRFSTPFVASSSSRHRRVTSCSSAAFCRNKISSPRTSSRSSLLAFFSSSTSFSNFSLGNISRSISRPLQRQTIATCLLCPLSSSRRCEAVDYRVLLNESSVRVDLFAPLLVAIFMVFQCVRPLFSSAVIFKQCNQDARAPQQFDTIDDL